jgi:hypothetical protein
VQPKSSSVWHTGLSGGAPDSVRCARLASGEQTTLGKNRWRTAIIHRTIRWCTGLSGEPKVVSATVGRAIRGQRVACANGRQGAPDYPVCTGQCPVRHLAQSCNGHLRQNRKEIGTGPSTVTVRWRTPNKNKTRGKRSCFKCGKTGHFIAQCPDNENDQGKERHGKKEKKKSYRKAKGEAHLGKEWDSNCSSSDSDDEGLAASVFNKSSLFPNECHTCLMAKEKKVSGRDSPKYSTSSDEDSSDNEVDYSSLFKGLDRAKVEKINELIDALNEKDRLLEKQEDILY